jgi:hypothetical protein
MPRSLLLMGLVLSCLPRCVAAQDAVLLELYGRGVHAYYAGQSHKAIEYLTSAIDAGSRDPRVFYFRGLAMEKSFCGAGDSDLRYAAELEVADAGDFYAVGRALERIQGHQRLKVERYRTEARLAALQRQQQQRRQRYQDLRRAEPEVTIPVAPRPALPAPVAPPAEEEFEMEEEAPAVLPPAPVELPAEDPFGLPTEESEPSVPSPSEVESSDPFGAEPEEMELPTAPEVPSENDLPGVDLELPEN